MNFAHRHALRTRAYGGIYNLTENFAYDNLDRLTTITKGANVRNISYQTNGNISSKFDAGAYTYDPVKIHSISRITDNNCTSAIDQALQNITYTPFKKVKTIQQQNDSLIYTYGHDMERRKMQLYENGQLVKIRIYCGMYEKETLADSAVKEFCYISGGGGVTAVLINQDMYYLRRDVQGTITGLVNQNDSIVEEYSYDAWGRRRNPTNWTYDSVPQPQLLYRGYTMHVLRNTDCGSAAHRNPNVEQIPIMYSFCNLDEDYIGKMLDEFGLINMNGRCYDPVVGRFLSPDIVVQNPNNTQCYNRYSYAINNPLKYSDPSGWSYGTLDQMHDNAQRAAGLEMNVFRKQMESFMNTHRNPKEPRNLLGLVGKNGLGGTADGFNLIAMGALVEFLRISGMAGVFGNPGDDDPPDGGDGDDKDPEKEKNAKGNTTLNMTEELSSIFGMVSTIIGKAAQGEVGIIVAGATGSGVVLGLYNTAIVGIKAYEDNKFTWGEFLQINVDGASVVLSAFPATAIPGLLVSFSEAGNGFKEYYNIVNDIQKTWEEQGRLEIPTFLLTGLMIPGLDKLNYNLPIYIKN